MIGGEDDKIVPTLLERLGNVLYWLGTGIAVLFFGISILIAFAGEGEQRWFSAIMAAVFAVASWGIGRALRYVLAGR